MTKKMQEYTEEFKQGAVNMVLKEGLSRSDVGRRLDTSCKNVSRWVKLGRRLNEYQWQLTRTFFRSV